MDAFREAKCEINSKFFNTKEQIENVKRICDNLVLKKCFQINNLKNIQVDLDILLTKLNREIISLDTNKIKVSCFGRTSNGKSTLLNAILGIDIIPTGLGQTTSCFISIEGTDDDICSATLMTENDEEIECTIDSIRDLSNAFSESKTTFGSIIHIKYPKRHCNLLDSDIILYDSPGIDDSDVSDYYIKKFCLDSDIFLYVCNAESSLMKIEKEFFFDVLEKVAKPNLFVLFNRWDLCINYKCKELLIQQHKDKITELMTKLQNGETKNLNDMIYFISAKQSLMNKIKNKMIIDTELDKDFIKFENDLYRSIKEESINTKFKRHYNSYNNICQHLFHILTCISEEIRLTLNLLEIEIEHFKKTSQEVYHDTQEFVDRISSLWERIDPQISDISAYLELTCVDLMNDFLKSELRFSNESSEVLKDNLEKLAKRLTIKLGRFIDSTSYSYFLEKIKEDYSLLVKSVIKIRKQYDDDNIIEPLSLEFGIFDKKNFEVEKLYNILKDFNPCFDSISITEIARWIFSLQKQSSLIPSGASFSTILLSLILMRKSDRQAIILLFVLSAASFGYDFSHWKKNYKIYESKRQAKTYLGPKIQKMAKDVIDEKYKTIALSISDYKSKCIEILKKKQMNITHEIDFRQNNIKEISILNDELDEVMNLLNH